MNCSQTTGERLASVVTIWRSEILALKGVGQGMGGQAMGGGRVGREASKSPGGGEWTGELLGVQLFRLGTTRHTMILSPQNSFGESPT